MTDTAKKIIELINSAVEQFGLYELDDKGLDEVADVKEFIDLLEPLTGKQAGETLMEVFNSGVPGAYDAVYSLVMTLSSQPVDWFMELLKVDDELQDMY